MAIWDCCIYGGEADVLDKAKGNLALARYKLSDIERSISV